MRDENPRNLVEVKYLTALEACARLGLTWDRWCQTYDELYGMLQAQGFVWKLELGDWSYQPEDSGHVRQLLEQIARQLSGENS